MRKTIAMRCNQEQFDKIKPKLKKNNLQFENIEEDWAEWGYLKNNCCESEKVFHFFCVAIKSD